MLGNNTRSPSAVPWAQKDTSSCILAQSTHVPITLPEPVPVFSFQSLLWYLPFAAKHVSQTASRQDSADPSYMFLSKQDPNLKSIKEV